jgi:hypothetical protein
MTALAAIFVVIKPETDRFEPQLRKKLAHVDALSAGTKAGSRFGDVHPHLRRRGSGYSRRRPADTSPWRNTPSVSPN